jgi:hypothetical protein
VGLVTVRRWRFKSSRFWLPFEFWKCFYNKSSLENLTDWKFLLPIDLHIFEGYGGKDNLLGCTLGLVVWVGLLNLLPRHNLWVAYVANERHRSE